MAWSEAFYAPVFGRLLAAGGPAFGLRENDYCLGAAKVGGNAQALSRGRFVHHTSFLWDYRPDAMALLQHPPKAPEYREVSGGR